MESPVDLTTIRASVDALAERVTASVTTVEKGLKTANENIDRIEAVLRRPGFTGEPANENGDHKAELGAIAALYRTADDAPLRAIHAAMHSGSDPDGGYFVTPAVSSTMTRRLYDESPMRRLARVETITAGKSWVEPLDLGEPEAKWVGERSERPATASPGLGNLEVPVHELFANLPVTQQLLDDAGFDLGSWIETKITDKFVRSESAAYLTGNGVVKPRGLLTYPTAATDDAARPWGTLQTLNSGGASSITADALIDLVWKLRQPYRSGAVFTMNSNTAAVVDKLKDGQGNYLWRQSYVLGAPATLLGYAVEIEEGMPDVAAGSTPIAFGNFKLGYVIVDRLGIQFLRDPFTAKPNVSFYAYRRVGGGLANSEAIKLMKIAA